ncbi:hypothetical protein [Flavobacterium tibetense]|uniref:Uncharacterized protein n=1 Tax=Flavobacterium tibetense TaxID=2233533 RepID=A0A365P457_9FLAO|nr:hypothetical protein [Flavobacterium tibetense]RBA29315.1 hypothetical protein DPN68_03955 [Flavobacterium tibetense]
MRKNTLIISLSILLIGLLTFRLFFQEKNDLPCVLSNKDFTELENCIKKLTVQDEIRGRWIYLRELSPDFKEGIFEYYQHIYKDGKKSDSYEVFQIKLITAENDIIHYEFSEQKNKKVKSDWSDSYIWKPYYVLIERFKNEKKLNNLKTTFKNNFQAELNEKELFLKDYTYGENCGVGAMNSKERIELNDFVVKNNKNSILNWLKSTNSEKQLYAVEGILKLIKSGSQFSKQELDLFRKVTDKKGTIKVCHGCIYSTQEVSEIIKNIKSQL